MVEGDFKVRLPVLLMVQLVQHWTCYARSVQDTIGYREGGEGSCMVESEACGCKEGSTQKRGY